MDETRSLESAQVSLRIDERDKPGRKALVSVRDVCKMEMSVKDSKTIFLAYQHCKPGQVG